jgi:phosphotransferase system  glucose/maltose/N-acetylglucosamine-specific IIC component
MMRLMQPQPQRKRHRRRFFRENRGILFIGFIVIVVVALVGLLFWVMTSSRFILH